MESSRPRLLLFLVHYTVWHLHKQTKIDKQQIYQSGKVATRILFLSSCIQSLNFKFRCIYKFVTAAAENWGGTITHPFHIRVWHFACQHLQNCAAKTPYVRWRSMWLSLSNLIMKICHQEMPTILGRNWQDQILSSLLWQSKVIAWSHITLLFVTVLTNFSVTITTSWLDFQKLAHKYQTCHCQVTELRKGTSLMLKPLEILRIIFWIILRSLR